MSSDHRTFIFSFLDKPLRRLADRCQKISFPGAKGLSLYEVVSLFFKGLSKGSLNIRATSIAFHFMLALGPAVIFLLGLIPYLPFRNLQIYLMYVLIDVIPENS